MKNLWVRLGVTLSLTDEEVEKLIGDNQVSMKEREQIIVKAVTEARFCLDGETYAPQEAISDFNEEYDTSYEENDYELFW